MSTCSMDQSSPHEMSEDAAAPLGVSIQCQYRSRINPVIFLRRFSMIHSGRVLKLLLPVLLMLLSWGDIPNGLASEGIAPLCVELTVKECAGTGSDAYPVTAVVPLSRGQYQAVDVFRLTDHEGNEVPAQFNVLNRWWAGDNSIRHLRIIFMPSLDAFTHAGTGTAQFYLKDDADEPLIIEANRSIRAETSNPSEVSGNLSDPMAVIETDDRIMVHTGPLKFIVDKHHFNIIDQAWLIDPITLTETEIITPSPENGAVFVPQPGAGDLQLDAFREDVQVVVEENGPLYTVIRAEALTQYHGPMDHTHGWAVRIYAWKGKPYVKVDYQLQNSAKNVKFSRPLYFDALSLNFNLNVGENPIVTVGMGDDTSFQIERGTGIRLAQEFHDQFQLYQTNALSPSIPQYLGSGSMADGFLDIYGQNREITDDDIDHHNGTDDSDDASPSPSGRGVMATTRYFWETWPNGIAVNGENRLSIELFPEWGAQLYDHEISLSGLYWLEDMQHVYKEVLLYFHDAPQDAKALTRLARTFTYHPVVSLPVSWYRTTKATLDLDGVIPIEKKASDEDQRRPTYASSALDPMDDRYNFGWDNFHVDVYRKYSPWLHGGWPYSHSEFIATENPADYYVAEQFAIGELNVRPQWMAGYDHETDFSFLQLTENPYAGPSWRCYTSKSDPWLDAPYMDGTDYDVKPRDDDHAWFYPMEEAYYFTANPWIRDWYEFVSEFRKVRLNRLDPWPNQSSRGEAHSLHHVLQAYRVTGNTDLIPLIEQYITTWLKPSQIEFTHGGRRETDFRI